jgi:hypothetical protein
MENRDQVISFKASKSEKKAMKEAAKKEDKRWTTWCRESLVEAYEKQKKEKM